MSRKNTESTRLLQHKFGFAPNNRDHEWFELHLPGLPKIATAVPALPGCTSQGDTIEEAIANAKEAIVGHIEALKQIGEPVPEEIERPQAITLEIAA